MDGFIDYDIFYDLLNELCNRCDMYWVDGYCAKNCRWAKYRYMMPARLMGKGELNYDYL